MVIVPTVALNVVELLFAGTVTDAGTVSALLFEESATALPPAGAASLRVIVHVVELPELTLAGLQASDETTAGSTKLTVVLWMLPFRLAVKVALWLLGRLPAVAMKVAELAPLGTVTEVGTLKRLFVSDSVTVVLAEAI